MQKKGIQNNAKKGAKKGWKSAKSGKESGSAGQQQQNEIQIQSLDDFMDNVEHTFVQCLTEAGSSKSHRVLVNGRISEMLKKMSKLAKELDANNTMYVC